MYHIPALWAGRVIKNKKIKKVKKNEKRNEKRNE